MDSIAVFDAGCFRLHLFNYRRSFPDGPWCGKQRRCCLVSMEFECAARSRVVPGPPGGGDRMVGAYADACSSLLGIRYHAVELSIGRVAFYAGRSAGCVFVGSEFSTGACSSGQRPGSRPAGRWNLRCEHCWRDHRRSWFQSAGHTLRWNPARATNSHRCLLRSGSTGAPAVGAASGFVRSPSLHCVSGTTRPDCVWPQFCTHSLAARCRKDYLFRRGHQLFHRCLRHLWRISQLSCQRKDRSIDRT